MRLSTLFSYTVQRLNRALDFRRMYIGLRGCGSSLVMQPLPQVVVPVIVSSAFMVERCDR